jgi:hypothetical protein
MRTLKSLRGMVVGVALATSLLMFAMPGVAFAKKTPELLTSAEQKELKEILKHVKYEPSGVGGKPTILVSEANVQIVNGAGSTTSANGAGNLILGYDDAENDDSEVVPVAPGEQTGSHNLIMGNSDHYHSYGSFVGGENNLDSAPNSIVVGEFNVAGAPSIVGGFENESQGLFSALFGQFNKTYGRMSSVLGGYGNAARGLQSSILGGEGITENTPYGQSY